MSDFSWDNTPPGGQSVPPASSGQPAAPTPGVNGPDYGPMLMEGLGFFITGIPGLGWAYLSEWGKFAAVFATYLGITALSVVSYFFLGDSNDTISIALTGVECILLLLIIGAVGFSTWKVYQYTRTRYYEKSLKRVILVVVSVWMFYCVLIGGLVAIITMIMAAAGS